MKPAAVPIPPRLKRIVALILISGIGAALAIYVSAARRPSPSTGYELEESKQYLRDMEVYGGKANEMASEFRHWFATLWQGRNLAFTIAFLTVLLALAVLLFGVPLPPTGNPHDPDAAG